jgi:hypothetical protein
MNFIQRIDLDELNQRIDSRKSTLGVSNALTSRAFRRGRQTHVSALLLSINPIPLLAPSLLAHIHRTGKQTTIDASPMTAAR